VVVNQLKRNDEDMNESGVVEKILRSLADEFENMVCAIEESKNLAKIMVDELSSSLKAHEQRKKKKKQEVLKETLKEEKSSNDEGARGRSRNGFRCRGRGHGRDRDRGQEESKYEKYQNSYGRYRGRGRGRPNKSHIQYYVKSSVIM
jgi:gag-polypeptide of LTR copia-type